MVAGALLLLAGVVLGWFLRGTGPARVESVPAPGLECPCGHGRNFHVEGRGKCVWEGDPYHRTGVGVIRPKCTCLAYPDSRAEATDDRVP